MLRYNYDMFLDSTPKSNVSVSQNGSMIAITMPEPLSFPRNAMNMSMCVCEATLWYNFPNIVTGVNDTIYIRKAPDLFKAYTIPQGLYTSDTLNLAIENALGAESKWVTFTAEQSTGRILIFLNEANVELNLTDSQAPRNFRKILGFDSQTLIANLPVPSYSRGESVSNFNVVNYVFLHSDVVQQGISFNGATQTVIAKVPLLVKAGSQVTHLPTNPPKMGATNLVGRGVYSFRVWLTDQEFRPINCNGETWSCRLQFSWYM